VKRMALSLARRLSRGEWIYGYRAGAGKYGESAVYPAFSTNPQPHRLVIPGRAKREPGIHNPQSWLWIPGLALWAIPE